MGSSVLNGDTIVDFITGRELPNIGAEANRQQVERLLVEAKGYAKHDIEVDAPIALVMAGQTYRSCLDLVVRVNGWRYMVVKCAPGSLASREREVIAAARLLDDYQIPLAVASDGQTAIVWDTISGKKTGQGLDAIPSRQQARQAFDPYRLLPLAESRRERQQLIFRSYDSMNVNKAGTAGPA
jgi:hypothetical protein